MPLRNSPATIDTFTLIRRDFRADDRIAFTSRVFVSGISNGLEMARPIFGRGAQLQLRYQF
jgi:hypothetical protein